MDRVIWKKREELWLGRPGLAKTIKKVIAMDSDWEDKFKQWSKPPSDTEQQRCDNAVNAVKNAIKSSEKLKERDIRIILQGSYQNNTNVRRESDVDIGVICYDVFFPDYPGGTTKETFSNNDGDYDYADYKKDIEEALVSYFGKASVKRGNKAFDIKETSYKVEADVVPFMEHRRYSKDGKFISGVELRPDNGKPFRVINWPEQHYENGVRKNNETNKRFKNLVRIFKSLCNEMTDNAINEAKNIPGFLIECLVWNVPNEYFGSTTFTEDVRKCLISLYNNTDTEEKCKNWGEVSELIYLFNSRQKWTRSQANDFILSAWKYIGFK
jgi:predicted nucleotidyltransferase